MNIPDNLRSLFADSQSKNADPRDLMQSTAVYLQNENYLGGHRHFHVQKLVHAYTADFFEVQA